MIGIKIISEGKCAAYICSLTSAQCLLRIDAIDIQTLSIHEIFRVEPENVSVLSVQGTVHVM